MTDPHSSLATAALQEKVHEPITWPGQGIRSFNALAVGTLAAFSLEKALVIFGVMAAGATPVGWILAAMILCGLAITAITFSMYHQDSYVIMREKFRNMGKGIYAWWKRLTGPAPGNEKKLEKGESGFIAVDAYGHLGGLIKFFMAFAGLWLLAGGMQAFWPLFIVMVLIGAAQYFVEASVLIPQSQALFSHKPNEYASPTHTLGNGAFSGFKWMLVLGHALGQGLGFFACMAIVGSIAPPLIPLAIAIGVAAMLVIGPSTGRFYGERFFRWGAGIACNPNEDGQYSIAALSTALIAKSVSQRSIDAALRVLRVGNGGLLDTEDKKKQQADDGMVPSEIPSAESFLRYFGYYLNEPVKHAWQDLSWLQKGLYGLGGAVGCFGAAFKGALAFAGTVVFLLLCTAQTLFVLATPPGWIIAAAMVIGVATWMVQCARACPNTANGFVSWTVSKAAETAYAGPERPGQVASTGLHAGPDDETLSDSDQYNREGFESKVKLFGGSERAADGGLAPVPVSGTTTTTNTDGRVVIITSM